MSLLAGKLKLRSESITYHVLIFNSSVDILDVKRQMHYLNNSLLRPPTQEMCAHERLGEHNHIFGLSAIWNIYVLYIAVCMSIQQGSFKCQFCVLSYMFGDGWYPFSEHVINIKKKKIETKQLQRKRHIVINTLVRKPVNMKSNNEPQTKPKQPLLRHTVYICLYYISIATGNKSHSIVTK